MVKTGPKKFVFVLMPFSKDFDDIYEVGIKQACIDADVYCERVDEQIFRESILEHIYNQIAKADIVVSDLSGKNPNVYYETGYAHALGKSVILLTQNVADIPFDLKHYPHIIYDGKIKLLKEELLKRIIWCKENDDRSLTEVERHLEFYINGVKIDANSEIKCLLLENSLKRTIHFNIDVYNPNMSMLKNSIMLGLIVPSNFSRSINGYRVVKLPDNRFLHLLHEVNNLFPQGWESINIELISLVDTIKNKLKGIKNTGEIEVEFIIRAFTELGTKDYPFKIKYKEFIIETKTQIFTSENIK